MTENINTSEHTETAAGLWKYEPIPDDIEPYPEYRTSYENLDGVEITAARVRGKKHKHEGSNCDDWYDYCMLGDICIAAVSDGAGSKKLSRIGAKVASEAVCAYIKDKLAEIDNNDVRLALSLDYSSSEFINVCSRLAELLKNAFSAAYSAVEGAYLVRCDDEAITKMLGRKCEIKDFSSTLLTAVVIPLENGESFVITSSVGDGMIAAVNMNNSSENAVKILGNADNGGFSGETEFLDGNTTGERLATSTRIMRGEFTSLLMMTDGVADDYYPYSPEILRLYLDLMLNGIVNSKNSLAITENNGDTIAYARELAEKNGKSTEQLWDCRYELNIKRCDDEQDKAEQLKTWLDSYYQRGSFDDRTLVIITRKEPLKP